MWSCAIHIARRGGRGLGPNLLGLVVDVWIFWVLSMMFEGLRAACVHECQLPACPHLWCMAKAVLPAFGVGCQRAWLAGCRL